MLNKLLKRCMPWMDKGRWYKLVLVGNGESFDLVTDESSPIFTGSTIQVSNRKITIMNPGIMFTDLKATYEYDGHIGAVTFGYMSAMDIVMMEPSYSPLILGTQEGAKLTLLIFGR